MYVCIHTSYFLYTYYERYLQFHNHEQTFSDPLEKLLQS